MFLSIGQASQALGTSVSTLRRWKQEGAISADYRTPGGHRSYSLRVLQDRLGLIADANWLMDYRQLFVAGTVQAAGRTTCATRTPPSTA